jgi:hypothetical protein
MDSFPDEVRDYRQHTNPACESQAALSGASGKRIEISRIVAYNGSCRSEGAQP